ncbi:hypothetical protein ABT095_05885 [Kitasatospora sp. NPDC002227]
MQPRPVQLRPVRPLPVRPLPVRLLLVGPPPVTASQWRLTGSQAA